MHDQHGLLETLARYPHALLRHDTHGAIFAHHDGWQVEGLDALAQRGLSVVEQGGNVGLVPRAHLGRQPLVARDGSEVVRRGGGLVRKQVVGLAAHDEQIGLLRWREVGREGHGVEQAVQARVVAVSRGVAGRGDDADADVLAQEVEEARDERAVGLEGLAVVVEGHITVERCELQVAVGGDGHDLRRVQDEAHVVEGRGDEAPGADEALVVLVFEGGLKGEAGEEGPDRGDEELQLRGWAGDGQLEERVCGDGGLQGDVVVDHGLDVAHDLGVAPGRLLGHLRECLGDDAITGARVGVEDVVRLRVKDEGDCEEALDPFCGSALLVSSPDYLCVFATSREPPSAPASSTGSSSTLVRHPESTMSGEPRFPSSRLAQDCLSKFNSQDRSARV